MITNVASLLDGVLDREKSVLDAVNIKHGPTIGDMYEGLTRETLDMAIPGDADLRVTHGFVRDREGKTSKQIDCMVVVGQGETIPYTDGEVCDLDSVLAVIEVKKNLYTSDLAEGYDNLLSVMDLTNSVVPRHINENVCRRFQAITRRPLSNDIDLMPAQERLLYHLLVVEMARPVRILLGYHGFRSERTLRKGVLEYVDSVVGKPGYGPLSLPHLIMNRQFAVGKANGMPWVSPWDADGTWPLLSSTGGRPMALLLLEVLWGRLCDRGIVSSAVFGDDRTVEAWNRLVDVRFQERPTGWVYTTWDARPVQPVSFADDRAWVPHPVTHEQVTTLVFMGRRGHMEPEVDVPPAEREAVVAALRGLQAVGLVGESFEKPGVWVHLTDRCDVVFTPEGQAFAAENNTGRLTRWLEERMRLQR
jgi:hypothetical protein